MIRRLHLPEGQGSSFGRYAMASVVALGCDLGTFLAALSAGVGPMAASAGGYGLGIVIHWLLSTRFVFAGGMASEGLARTAQKGLFVATALMGLGLTTFIVGAGHWLGGDPVAAKAVAVIASFILTYGARRVMVFRT